MASGHRAGTDAILLAAAAGSADGLLIDAGAGVGAAGLAVASRCPATSVILVEINPDLVELARGNITANWLSDRARVIACDILSARSRHAAGLTDAIADTVIANPPWLTPGRSRASPDAARALAHVARDDDTTSHGVDGWIRAAAALLKGDGRLVLIHRADSLADVLRSCEGRFGDLAILPVYPRADQPAIRLMISGRKGSRAPMRLAPGLVLHDDSGSFTARAEAVHRGEATIDLF